MILNNIHTITENPIVSIIALCPTAKDIDGATVYMDWKEEAQFDAINGMFWPGVMAHCIAEEYRKKGETLQGIATELAFPNESGCIVTFKVT